MSIDVILETRYCSKCEVEVIVCDSENLCIPCLVNAHKEAARVQYIKKNANRNVPVLWDTVMKINK